MSDTTLPPVLTKQANRNILTDLVDRDEVMRFLAVAEAAGLPALLEGVAGVGKTKSLTDYAKAYYRAPGMDEREVGKKTLHDTFILEVDEGTRPGEVKGRIDMKKLLVDNDYELISPITDAKFVLINEIDKATASLRNSFLGIMNEKFLFNGKDKVKCRWEVFVATCNKIPEDEKDSPFWDRFVLKMQVKRVPKGMMLKYWENQATKTPPKQQIIKIPTKDEMALVRISPEHLTKFMDTCYAKLSDRTLSYVPRIVAAIVHVYKMPVTRALVKCADILVDYNTGKTLASLLEPAEVANVRGKIDLVVTITDRVSLQTTLNDIELAVNKLHKSGTVGADTIQDLMNELAFAVENNPLTKQNPVSSPFGVTPNASGSTQSSPMRATPAAQAGLPHLMLTNTAEPSIPYTASASPDDLTSAILQASGTNALHN